MAERKKRRQTKWKSALLAGLVLAVVIGFVGASVSAADKGDEKSADKQATLFDPFSMRTVVLANGTGAAPAELKLTRRSIRIPFRPALRSAFRPVW
jgi:hypothetical protein